MLAVIMDKPEELAGEGDRRIVVLIFEMVDLSRLSHNDPYEININSSYSLLEPIGYVLAYESDLAPAYAYLADNDKPGLLKWLRRGRSPERFEQVALQLRGQLPT